MRKLCIAFLMTFISGTSFCQNDWMHQCDSMFTLLRLHPLADSGRVDLLLKTGKLFGNNQPDSAVYYFNLANTLSNTLNYTKGKLGYMACMVELLEVKAKFEEAMKLALEAVALAERTHRPALIAAAYSGVANLYDDVGDIEKELFYNQKEMVIYEQLGDKWNLVNVYGKMLAVYTFLEKLDNAYQFGLKAIAISREINNKEGEALVMINLSDVLLKMKHYDSAILLSKQQYDICKKLNDKSDMLIGLGNINIALLTTNQLATVEKNCYEIEQLAIASDYKEGLAYSKFFLGQYWFKLKNYPKAKAYAQETIDILNKFKLRDILSDAHKLLGNIALASGDIALFEKEDNLVDSVRNINIKDKIIKYNQQLETEYSVSLKQAEINNLTKEKEITALTLRQRYITISVLIASMILLSLLGLLYYRNAKQKNKLLLAQDTLKAQRIRELEQEQQLLATESVLQGQEQERQRLAKDLHDGLGGILSSTKYSFSNMKNNMIITEENVLAFERSMGMLDKSISELRRVAHNMMPEALLKFGLDTALQDFCANIRQSGAVQLVYQSFEINDETIPQNKASIIYRMVQELVNNILKHAGASNALVQIIRKENTISITVEDNGKGFDTAILKHSNGIGYNNLQSRVTYLNGTMDIQTGAGKGTSVNIEINL